MKSAGKIIAHIVLSLFLLSGFAQQPNEKRAQPAKRGQKKSFQGTRSEFIWGINTNTSGWVISGLVLKKSIRTGERIFRTYGLEIMNIKHPQETRIRSYANNPYLYGKINYLYALRLQYGYDIVLFNNKNRSGVEIRLGAAAGPSIGIVSPYYIQWQASFGGNIQNQPYDPSNSSHAYSRIIGPGYLLEGLGESRIQMGANIKIGLSFETGALARRVTGFDVGFLFDAYFKKIDMLANAKQVSLFPTLYLTLFYGSRK